MGYYVDQLAEQDRQKRLADLLAMQQDNIDPGVQYDTGIPDQRQQFLSALADPNNTIRTSGFDENFMRGEPYMPPQQSAPMPQNYIRNERTGAVTDLGQSQPSRPIGDMSQVSVDTPYGRGYYMKGDNTKVVLGDGRIADLGRDTGRERAIEKESLGLAAQRANIAHTKAQSESMSAKPVAVYGPDGKTPQYVSAKDAIGKKPYSASIAGQGEFTPETLRMVAEQYLAGDRQAVQGYARNASAKMALANEITKVAAEKGMNGKDTAAIMADYAGMMAGSRVLGARTANIQLAAGEAAQMIPLAVEASKNVARSGFLPFGKVQVMFDDQTNVPELRQFAAANLALINTYARAISPTGVPTQADKEHARKILSIAQDQTSYEATVNQMKKEMDAALAAPERVRAAMKEGISGKAAPAATSDVPKVMTVQDVMDTAKARKKTTDQVMKDARAAGFTIK